MGDPSKRDIRRAIEIMSEIKKAGGVDRWVREGARARAIEKEPRRLAYEAALKLWAHATEEVEKTKESGSGCFIATAAFGTPLASEINVLRRYRNSILLKNKVGRIFVIAYYKISPPIAYIIRYSAVLKRIVRKVVRVIIRYIKQKYEI